MTKFWLMAMNTIVDGAMLGINIYMWSSHHNIVSVICGVIIVMIWLTAIIYLASQDN